MEVEHKKEIDVPQVAKNADEGTTRDAVTEIDLNTEPKHLNLEEYFEFQLIKNRIVLIHGAVYGCLAERATKRLEYLASVSNEPIKVILNSVGGSVYDGLLIFNTIKALVEKGIEVTCEARGLAASMGSIILQAGSKRIATPYTRFLIHEVSSWLWGDTTKVEERIEEMRKLNDMLNGIYVETTGKTLEEINALTKKTDLWMSTEEALDFGLIDSIAEEPKGGLMEGLGLPAGKTVDLTPEPIKLHLFCESFKFDGKEVSGIAIHPGSIWHPEEGQTHDYLKEELELSVKTSRVPVPFGEDHLRILPKANRAHELFYNQEQNGIGFRGTVDKIRAQNIKNKMYKGLSIELNWFRKGVVLEKMNGMAPRNFEVTAIHFMKQYPPGDRETYVKMWEGILLPVAPPFDVQIDQLRQMFEQRLSFLEGQVTKMTGKDNLAQVPASAVIIFKESTANVTAEISNLRNLLGEFDKLKEAVQIASNEPEKEFTAKAKILTDKIDEYTKGMKLLDERLKTYKPESELAIELRKKIFELNEQVDELTAEKRDSDRNFRLKYNELHDGILAVLPPPHVWMAWRVGGPKIMMQKLLGVLNVDPKEYYS